jgi:hypothetical protein
MCPSRLDHVGDPESRNLRQQVIPEPQFIFRANIRQRIPLRSKNETLLRQATSKPAVTYQENYPIGSHDIRSAPAASFLH